MANKRIIEQTASTTISNDDWLIKDSPTDGTTKIQASVFKTLMNDGMASDEDLADAIENIAGEYDSEVEYSKDALCFKDGVLYIANADTTGTWDSTKWNATTIADIIANLRIDANDVVDVSVKGDSLVNSSKIAVLDSLTAQGSASGSIASFSDGSTHPMSKLEVAIDPIQDLHGYDYPWVGGSGKNKLPNTATTQTINGITFTVNDDGTIKANGTATADATLTVYGANASSASDIPISSNSIISLDTTNVRGVVWKSGGGTTFDNGTYNISAGTTLYGLGVRILSGSTVNNLVIKPMLCLASVSDATYEPYSNICPISGFTEANVSVVGKNWFDLDAVTSFIKGGVVSTQGLTNQDGVITNSKSYGGDGLFPFYYPMTFSSNTITVSADIKLSGNHSSNNVFIQMFDSNGSNIVANGEVTMSSKDTWEHKTITLQLSLLTNVNLVIEARGTNNSVQIKNVQVEIGSTATTYESYNEQTYTVEFKDGDNPLTVYGGTLDVISGKLVVDRASVDLGTLNWVYQSTPNGNWRFIANLGGAKHPMSASTIPNMICSNYKTVSPDDTYLGRAGVTYNNGSTDLLMLCDKLYSDVASFKTAMNGVQLVYELDTPQTYQLTPTQVNSLLGTNNVWADTGDVNEAVYTRDLNTTVNDIISRIEALENA